LFINSLKTSNDSLFLKASTYPKKDGNLSYNARFVISGNVFRVALTPAQYEEIRNGEEYKCVVSFDVKVYNESPYLSLHSFAQA